MLLGNYSVLHKSPLRFFGGSTTSVEPQLASNFNKSGSSRNSLYVSGATTALTLYSLPSGNAAGKTWLLPQKSGEMSSRNDCVMTLTAAGAGVGGITSTGTAGLTILADGIGSLITSGAGSASVTFTVDGFLTASLQAVGAASFTISTNTPLLGAEAGLIGSASFAIAGALTPYAIGSMSGSTVDGGALTAASVASAVWTQAIEAGYTAEQVLRILAAHAAGAATGLEGSDPQFTGLDGATVRINGTYSSGTRTIDAINAA